MSYLGNSPVLSQQEYRNIDDISGSFNGSTTSFALLVNGVAPVPAPQASNQCLISVNGVVQKPDDTGATGFRLSGGNIVFSAAPSSGQAFFGVILAGADYIYAGQNYPDGTVSAPSITFAQDLDTGFYRSGAGEVKFTANGANTVTLSSNNLTAPSFIPTSSSAPTNGVYLSAANTVAIATNSAGKLFINSSGQVGIGTSSPSNPIHVVNNSGTVATAYFNNISTGGDSPALIVQGGANNNNTVGTFEVRDYSGNTDFKVQGDGRVGIGTTSPAANFVVSNAGADGVEIYPAGTGDGSVLQAYSRSGGTFRQLALRTGELVIQTNGPNERARIDSSGRLLVGTSSARSNFFNSTNSAAFQLEGQLNDAATASIVQCYNANTQGATLVLGKSNTLTVGANALVADGHTLGRVSYQGNDGTEFVEAASISAQVDGTPGSNDMPGRLVFSTTADGASSPTEVLRLDNQQRFVFGTTAAYGSGGLTFHPNYSNGATACFFNRANNTNQSLVFDFRNNSTTVGSIYYTNTATTYATTSDYRLKENVAAISDGIDRVKQLKPSRFNFIVNPDQTVDGFLAHEVQGIVPEAIGGDKDAVDEDGKPIYQNIDQSKLVPLLTAALQEAIGRIEILEAEVAALKGA